MARYIDLEHSFHEGHPEVSAAPANRHRRICAGVALGGGLAAVCFAATAAKRTISITTNTNKVLGLAGESFADLGYGKCRLEDGSDPEHQWHGSGDVGQMCAENPDCKGYSSSMYGGGLLWMSGPLKGGGDSWGGCHCKVRQDEAPEPPPTTTEPPPPPKVSKSSEDIQAELDADAGDASEFPNVHLISVGYNIFYSDPMPKIDKLTTDTVNVDPGIRKPVFSIKYTQERLTGDRRHKRPDGYFATVDYGCSEVFSTKTISDSYGMTTERNLEASVTDQVGLDIDIPPTSDRFSFSHGDVGIQDTGGGPLSLGAFVGGSGTLSGSYKSVKKQNILQDNRMVVSSARCAVYSAGIAYGFPPETHPDFKAAFEGATSNAEWHDVFDEYGTHFMANIKMGARFGTTMIFRKSHYDAMYSTLVEAGVQVGPVVEAAVKTMVTTPEIEDALSVSFDPSAAIPDIPLVAQEQIETLNSHASAAVMQGVGPVMPDGGASKWMDEVEKNPVPIRYSKIEICAHPGMEDDQRKACAEALSSYCEDHLKAKGAECSTPQKQQCQMDSDCSSGRVCRGFVCQKVPVCYVSVYGEKNFGGHEYSLDPVTSVDNPDGKPVSMRLDNWHDKISSVKLGKGCKKVKLFDDDPGNFFEGQVDNREFSSSQTSLDRDLNDDVWQVWIWANDVPGEPPFQPGAGSDPGNLPKPTPITFDPEKDTLYAEPSSGRGLKKQEEKEYFPNIGKAMYGYNHFHGAPFSTKYAGTDPGFQGRGVWKLSYDSGEVGQESTWKRMPMAPLARYFVLFASKHPQIQQIQDNGKDPDGAAVVYLTGKQTWLQTFLQNTKDGKNFNSWLSFHQRTNRETEYTEPELPVTKAFDEFCALQYNNTELIEEIDKTGNEVFKEQKETYYHNRYDYGGYGGYYRRLRAVGAQFCENGKVRTWSEEDKKQEDERIRKEQERYENYYGGRYGGYYRRLASAQQTGDGADSRRLRASNADAWFSTNHKPNMREFGSLAKAKQALRSETRCIGVFSGTPCPSGADYDLNVEGTTWEFSSGGHSYYYDRYYEDPQDQLKEKLQSEWPRFIVKVMNDKVDSVEVIDSQDQTKQWREGFDSNFPPASGRTKMLEFLETHIEENPTDGEVHGELEAIDTNVPDGWRVIRSKGGAFCEQDMKTDTVSDAHSYEKLTSSSFGIPTTSATLMGNGFSFGLSYEKRDLLKMQGQKGEKMMATQAECASFYASILDLDGSPPETEPSLEFLVGKAEKSSDFWIIFDQYGLHFPTEVVFGARYGSSQYIKQSSFEKYQENSESLSLDFGAQVAIPTKVPGVDIQASRDVSIGYSATDSDKEVSKKYFNERRTFSVGKRMPEGGMDEWIKDIDGEPMPIKFGLTPLCEHPVFKDKKAKCEAANLTYCEQHLRRLHPDVECGLAPKSECLWDLDCPVPHSRCIKGGVCEQKPKCEVQLFKGGNLDGQQTTIGPVFYSDHQPYTVIDLEHVSWGNFKGKVKSLRMSGGCGKLVKMGSNNLNGGDNFAFTNHQTNDAKDLKGVANANYFALYPKQYGVDEGSEWFAAKR